MVGFNEPVKYLGTETRSGEKNGRPWEITEALIYVPDLGRVKVLVNGKPSLPAVDSVGRLTLEARQGKFQALSLVWNERASFVVASDLKKAV